jgi:hypothetical protein
MKKVWNVYQRKDGFRVAVLPDSIDDRFDKNHSDDYTFLGQVTEEIEEPKKEVEKVVEKVGKAAVEYYYHVEKEKKVFAVIPNDAYDFTVHYKIKE